MNITLVHEKHKSHFSTPFTPTAAQKVEGEKVINLMNGKRPLAIEGEILTGEMKSSINNNDGLVKFSAKRK